MNKAKKITIYIICMVLVLLILVGVTYGYYLSQINGNENQKSVEVATDDLSITYSDSSSNIIGSGQYLVPGELAGEKTFTVTNTGSGTVNDYGVIIENVVNDFVYYEDLELSITCKNIDNSSCNGYSGFVPKTNEVLLVNSIADDNVQTYTVRVYYNNTNVDQTIDMGKTLSGRFNIIDTDDTIDIKGRVTGAVGNDYIKLGDYKSNITSFYASNGSLLYQEYKLVGVIPGSYTLSVYNSSTLITSKQLILNKANQNSISSNTINFNTAARYINIDINRSSGQFTIGNQIINLN